MRNTWRHISIRNKPTRVIALIVSLGIVLYLYTSRSTLANTVSFTDPVPSSSESIQSLWRHWSRIIDDSRPRINPIRLKGSADAVSISSDDDGPREPPKNHMLISESDVVSLQSSHAALLQILRSEDAMATVFNGTGVVMVGGGEYFGPVVVGLHMLRRTGSTLPVEVFVADETEYESELCEDVLSKLGASCVVLSHFLRDTNVSHSFQVTHYQLKSLAMLFSSFAEVLYLDSDSIPLVDPSTELFSKSPLFYRIAGLPSFPSNLPRSSTEAGQILINKRTHLKTLLLAIYYNIYGPDYYYPLLSQGVVGQGDKETFLAAAVVVDEKYYRVKTPVATVGRHDGQVFRGSAMIQHHPADDLLHAGLRNTNKDNDATHETKVRPAFIHANTPKMNAGHLVDEGDLFALDKTRLRLWGSREDQEKRLGCDLEKVVWEILVQAGCELENIVHEWKPREGMCSRLQEHWKEVFEV